MRRTSFASASVVRFLALALTPLVAVGVFAGAQIAELQRQTVGYRNSVLAESVRSETQAFLTSPEIAAVQFGHRHEGKVSSRQGEADSLTDHLPMLESVAVTNLDGITVAASVRPGSGLSAEDMMGLDHSREPLFLAAKETTTPVWSRVFTSPASGRRALGMALASEDGVLLTTVDIESLADMVRVGKLEPGTQVVVTDDSGTVLFHSDSSVADSRPNFANLKPIAEGVAGRAGSYRFVENGKETLGSTALVGNSGWVVLVEQPWEAANLPVVEAWAAIGLFMVVVAGVAVVAAIIFAHGLSRPVVGISADALRVAQGDYSPSDTAYRHRELEMLADSIRATAAAVSTRETDLARSRHALEEINARLEEALAEQASANARLTAMSAELSIAEERERRRLAEELHDRVSQSLAVARMRLGMAAGSTPFDSENAAAALRLLTQAIAESRAITNELAPPILYELGLGAALREMADRIGASHGVHVTVEILGDETGLTDETKTLLLRSARELVVNAAKYSGSEAVTVRFVSERDEFVLTVEDEGKGFDTEQAQTTEGSGFGLFSIRQRLLHVGGSCEVESAPGYGTRVSVRVPREIDDSAEDPRR